MEAIKKIVFLCITIAILSACDDSSDEGNGYCVSPVELSGRFEPSAPGYIVFFNDSVSATDEVNLFIQTYEDLEVGSIFGSLNGFFANMGAITMENIRCEPSVDSIEYNGVISIND
jgi:hypothetical protein